jgi:integrase/recombinase XerD
MNNTFQVRRVLVRDALLTSSSNKSLIEEYLCWKKSYTRTAYRAYKLWVTRFQEFVNRPPESMVAADYTAFACSLQGRHASRGIEFALNVVHNYLRYFAEQGRINFPLYMARVPRGITQSYEAFEEEEYRAVVASLQSQGRNRLRNLAMIMLLHDTGMRIGELLSLEIDDLEEDCSAVIHTEKTVRHRRVFWNGDTDNVLQRYLVERINQGSKETESLFLSDYRPAAKAITRRSVDRILKIALEKSGIERRLCLHSFRHAFIHRLAKLSVPDAIIAQLPSLYIRFPMRTCQSPLLFGHNRMQKLCGIDCIPKNRYGSTSTIVPIEKRI